MQKQPQHTDLKSLCQKITAGNPALFILAGILNGFLPLLESRETGMFPACLWSLPLPLLFLLFRHREAGKIILCTILGATAFFIHRHLPADHYARILPFADCGAEIRADITDTACAGKQLPWLSNPALVQAAVREIKLPGKDGWRRCSGNIVMRFTPDAPLLRYGETIIAKGAFLQPGGRIPYQRISCRDGKIDAAGRLQGFDYKAYLESRNVYRSFQVSASQTTGYGGASAPLRRLFALRNLILDKVTTHLNDVRHKQLIATLIFGCRQGLDRETCADFIKSGTIHIFTVSGTHVAILAAVFLYIFGWLPFRLRYLVIPGLISCYVLTAGMDPPAVRALIMISLWSCCRAFLYYTPALNIVFLSASLLLLFNPFYIQDIGFQYSFTIVIFLLLSADAISNWLRLPFEKMQWLPKERWTLPLLTGRKITRDFNAAVLACIVAWLASCGILLFYQGIYVPYTVPANLVILPLVWLIFMSITAGLLLAPFGGLILFCSGLLAWLLTAMSGFIEFICRHFTIFAAITPPVWTLFIFYFALILLVTANNRRMFFLSAGTIAIITLYWQAAPLFSPPSVAILHGGGSQEATLIITPGGGRAATVVNVPSNGAAAAITNYLRFSGVNRIDRLIIAAPGKDFCAGAPQLINIMPVRQLIIRGNTFHGRYAAAMLQTTADSKIPVIAVAPDATMETSNLKLTAKNQKCNIEYMDGCFNLSVSITDAGDGVKTVVLTSSGFPRREIILANSNITEMKELVFK